MRVALRLVVAAEDDILASLELLLDLLQVVSPRDLGILPVDEGPGDVDPKLLIIEELGVLVVAVERLIVRACHLCVVEVMGPLPLLANELSENREVVLDAEVLCVRGGCRVELLAEVVEPGCQDELICLDKLSVLDVLLDPALDVEVVLGHDPCVLLRKLLDDGVRDFCGPQMVCVGLSSNHSRRRRAPQPRSDVGAGGSGAAARERRGGQSRGRRDGEG
mmetsp:Transcript_34750/g.68145  ORF Transcript_34750/g.68145 Transcript_34750/m.68145 type:complete len:220 (+) Transcript_34750:713-1372(+)